MNKLIVSERFDVDDIRKIREYNSLCHINMTPAEIVEDMKERAAAILEHLQERHAVKI